MQLSQLSMPIDTDGSIEMYRTLASLRHAIAKKINTIAEKKDFLKPNERIPGLRSPDLIQSVSPRRTKLAVYYEVGPSPTQTCKVEIITPWSEEENWYSIQISFGLMYSKVQRINSFLGNESTDALLDNIMQEYLQFKKEIFAFQELCETLNQDLQWKLGRNRDPLDVRVLPTKKSTQISTFEPSDLVFEGVSCPKAFPQISLEHTLVDGCYLMSVFATTGLNNDDYKIVFSATAYVDTLSPEWVELTTNNVCIKTQDWLDLWYLP